MGPGIIQERMRKRETKGHYVCILNCLYFEFSQVLMQNRCRCFQPMDELYYIVINTSCVHAIILPQVLKCPKRILSLEFLNIKYIETIHCFSAEYFSALLKAESMKMVFDCQTLLLITMYCTVKTGHLKLYAFKYRQLVWCSD